MWACPPAEGDGRGNCPNPVPQRRNLSFSKREFPPQSVPLRCFHLCGCRGSLTAALVAHSGSKREAGRENNSCAVTVFTALLVLLQNLFDLLSSQLRHKILPPPFLVVVQCLLYRTDGVEQSPIARLTISRGNDRRFRCDHPSFLQPCHIFSDRVLCHTNCIANGFIAWVALVRLSVLAEKQIAVNCNLTGMQFQLEHFVGNKKTIFDRISFWSLSALQFRLLSYVLDVRWILLYRTNVRPSRSHL